MNVSNETKQAFANTSNPRVLVVNFPNINLTVDMSHIIQESFSLKESILESDSIEFVGCVASEMSVQLYGITDDLKGQIVKVSIKVITEYDQQEQPIYSDSVPLFFGIVDSVEMEANHNKRKITAYDLLYSIGNVEVAPWYKSLNFSKRKKGLTIAEIRNSLFNYISGKIYGSIGIQVNQVSTNLPNDNIFIQKQYKPTTLRSIDVIKNICQINGVFGIVNRDYTNGRVYFEYRTLSPIEDNASYPSSNLFMPFLPGLKGTPGGEIPTEYVPYYRNIDYQEYTVKPVDKITIRDSDDVDGYCYPKSGAGENNYIIQGNIFAYKLKKATVESMAENIYPYVSNIVYRPFESENDGLPWIECGSDIVSYQQYDYEQSTEGHDVYTLKKYYVFNREMKGIQSLKDVYSATGEQDQRQFLTDVNTRINTLIKKTEEVEVDLTDYYNKEEIDEMLSNLPTEGWSVESVSQLPSQGEEQVLYLIQGEVVVN